MTGDSQNKVSVPQRSAEEKCASGLLPLQYREVSKEKRWCVTSPSRNCPPGKADQAPIAPADVWLVGYYKDTFGITQRLRKTSGSNSLDA